jgi:uncharacterized delta-60 repeat protein
MKTANRTNLDGFRVHRLNLITRAIACGAAVWFSVPGWAGPGDPDPAFSVPPVAGGFPTAVSAVAVQLDGKILMGGNFTNVWGFARSGVARLNADGSLDPDFAPTNVPPDIRAIAVQADGKVVLGIGYPTSSTPSLMRLNADGSPDTNFAVGFAPANCLWVIQ